MIQTRKFINLGEEMMGRLNSRLSRLPTLMPQRKALLTMIGQETPAQLPTGVHQLLPQRTLGVPPPPLMLGLQKVTKPSEKAAPAETENPRKRITH